jgi:hypothetical protein
VTSTQLAGTTPTFLNSATNISWTSSPIFVTNNFNATNQPAIPANSYVYAIAIQYWGLASNSNITVYTNTNTSLYTGFNQLGGTLPATYSTGLAQSYINYYVLKSPSTTNGPSNGLLAVYTGNPTVGGQPSGTYLPYYQATTNTGVHYKNGSVATPSDTLLGASNVINVGIQALTTTVLQW